MLVGSHLLCSMILGHFETDLSLLPWNLRSVVLKWWRQHGLHEATFWRLAGLACRYCHPLTVAMFWSCNVQHAATVLYGKKISGSTNMAENLLLRVCVRWHADLLLVHHVLSSAHPRCAGSRPDSEVSRVLSSCNTCLSLLPLVLEWCTARMFWLIFFCSLPQ